MKSDMTNAILTFVVGVSMVLGMVFAVQAINYTRELRSLQAQQAAGQNSLVLANLLMLEAQQYGKTHPDITPILQPFEAKPTAPTH